MEHMKFVKYILPAERIISEISDYERFVRKSKLRINPSTIPDLKWEWIDNLHTTDISTVHHMEHFYKAPEIKGVKPKVKKRSDNENKQRWKWYKQFT